ncbi:hypothetical protein BP5796_10513 [Coleophoma crateriformis]|uniref:mannan endo-1,6-alpha-mannosidase n=1 Tax=Coleophoma crateriformis TaxID=565419 RepID=A0A3D8QQM8_9HELO|nr:hypothetical protein BP5796_10513 [Coleophoma crateriformis]
MASRLLSCAWIWLLLVRLTVGIQLDLGSTDSIKKAASDVAWGLVSYYKGNESGQIPGLLPGPYYWWEAGAMMGSMVDYWHYTGDATYNSLVSQALQFQVGADSDYMPANESASLGNDDQAFWGMAAMSAAETNFPNPPAGHPSWLALAQAVFNEQSGRWDTSTCGGGIRWQIYMITGYNLKNTIANGCLFNIASRLARYTGDDKYAQWAVKLWDWLEAVHLIDNAYNVYDNAEASNLNCTEVDHHQWSYNTGTLLLGAATMYNYTNGSEVWYNRTLGLLTRTAEVFLPDGVMQELCEESNGCNVDQHSFKAYLSRWMAATTQMAPFTYNTIVGLLRSSAVAAAAQCTGTVPGISVPAGQVCGLKWYLNGTWDGSNGVGQQMAAMEVILGTLINQVAAPLTNSTGGTSIGNPTAGRNTTATPDILNFASSRSSKIGGWFLTAFILISTVWTIWFMATTSWEHEGINGPTVNGMYKRERRNRPISALEKGKGRESFIPKRDSALVVLPGIDEEKPVALESIHEMSRTTSNRLQAISFIDDDLIQQGSPREIGESGPYASIPHDDDFVDDGTQDEAAVREDFPHEDTPRPASIDGNRSHNEVEGDKLLQEDSQDKVDDVPYHDIPLEEAPLKSTVAKDLSDET